MIPVAGITLHKWSTSPDPPSGWALDGPSFEVYVEEAPGRIGLHQLYAPGNYLVTTNATEGTPTYEYDQQFGYCEIVSSDTATKPLWRLYNEALNKHLVSKDQTEIDYSLTVGYSHEALLCYVP